MLEADHPLLRLSGWAARVFSSLPEYTCSNETRPDGLPERELKPCPVNYSEVQSLFEVFDRAATSRLRVPDDWLDGKLPTSVMRNKGTGSPAWNVDLTAPFVRRKDLTRGDRLVLLGDLHGSVHSLLRQLLRLRSAGLLNDDYEVIPKNCYIVFLGDLVDRGSYGVEVWVTVMRLYAASPDNVLLVRGNHEERRTWPENSFAPELTRKFPGILDGVTYEQHVAEMFTIFCERCPHAIFMSCEPDEGFGKGRYGKSLSEPGKAVNGSGGYNSGRDSAPPATAVPKGAGKGEKGVPPPPPAVAPRPKDAPKEDWKTRAARLAEEAKPQNQIIKSPPLTSEWVQFCHGGIEPRYDPRPLLTSSGKTFAVTGVGPSFDKGRFYEGFNWSDFTGIDNDGPDRFGNVDPRGYHTGFCCDIPDTKYFSQHVGIRAFFRGHQDTCCSFKLVVKDEEEVITWKRLLAAEGHSENSLRRDGIDIARFLETEDTVPVFTFSSCVEARALEDEGFGLVLVDECLAQWKLRACIYPVERLGTDTNWVDEQYVVVHYDGWGIAKSLYFSRQVNPYQRRTPEQIQAGIQALLRGLPPGGSGFIGF